MLPFFRIFFYLREYGGYVYTLYSIIHATRRGDRSELQCTQSQQSCFSLISSAAFCVPLFSFALAAKLLPMHDSRYIKNSRQSPPTFPRPRGQAAVGLQAHIAPGKLSTFGLKQKTKQTKIVKNNEQTKKHRVSIKLSGESCNETLRWKSHQYEATWINERYTHRLLEWQ